jgi:hypothetical protein
MDSDEPIDVIEQMEAPHQPQEEAHEESAQDKPIQESKQDRNWREMRKKLESYERELAELKDRQKPQAVEEEESDLNLHDDDVVTVKDVKKLATKLAKNLYEQEKKKTLAETAEDRLRSKYNDFDEVVSEENVKKLLKEEPELAQVLKATADPFAKGVAAYRYIRMMERANPETVDKQAVRQNLSKPRTTTSIKDSGLDHVEEFASGRMTHDMRQKLYQEMRDAQGRR